MYLIMLSGFCLDLTYKERHHYSVFSMYMPQLL